MPKLSRLEWMFRFERNIAALIPNLGLRDNQGVIIEGFDFRWQHVFDCLGEMIIVSAKRSDGQYKYSLKESDTSVPLFIGNIVEFDGDYITHKVGDLYWDTIHKCKWWALKERINHFLYKFRIIHRWKIRRMLKRAE